MYFCRILGLFNAPNTSPNDRDTDCCDIGVPSELPTRRW